MTATPGPRRCVSSACWPSPRTRCAGRLWPQTPIAGLTGGAPAINTAAKSIRWLGTGLLLLGGLLACALLLLAYEGCIIYQVATGPNLLFSVPLVLVNLGYFAASCIPRWASPRLRWYSMGKIVAGAGLSIRAIASSSGSGHPLLFAIISYCGYAISAVVWAVRDLSRLQHAE